MKILVVGSGGREHAIIWKLKQSAKVTEIFCAPGNPGIAELASCIDLKVDQIKELADFAQLNKIDLTIVGPELPLTLGIVDHFDRLNLRIFGPDLAGAEMEASKAFCKDVMVAAGVPTASYQVFNNEDSARAYLKSQSFPVVIKADGLAAGKGVVISPDLDSAETALKFVFNDLKADKIVIEEFLDGVEASLIVATDGERVVPLCVSNDYKTIYDGNTGPNTGGMGTVSPTQHLPVELEQNAIELVIKPVIQELAKRGIRYRGFLYAGLMISKNQRLNVLEFNARCGDPETQVIMSRMEGDLAELLYALSGKPEERLSLPEISWSNQAAVCLVLACKGYPLVPVLGDEISGIAQAQLPSIKVFHAGTKNNSDQKLVTAGGRVLNVVAMSDTVDNARQLAITAAKKIDFAGKQFREDIGRPYWEIKSSN